MKAIILIVESPVPDRTTNDPDWSPQELAMWLAHQTASTFILEEISSIVHVDDRVVHRAFKTMAELAQPADYYLY